MILQEEVNYKVYFQYFWEILSVLYGKMNVSVLYVEEDENTINLDSFYRHSCSSELPPLLVYQTLRYTHLVSDRIPDRVLYFRKRCYSIFSQLRAAMPYKQLRAFDDDVRLHWDELDRIYLYSIIDECTEVRRKGILNYVVRSHKGFMGVNWEKLAAWSVNDLSVIYDVGDLQTLLQLSKARLFRGFVHLAEEYNQVREYLGMKPIEYNFKKDGFAHFINRVLEDVSPKTTNKSGKSKSVLDGHYKYSRINPDYLYEYLDELDGIFRISNSKCHQKKYCAIFLILYESKIITNCPTFKSCVTLLCRYFGKEEPKDCRPNKYREEAKVLKNLHRVLDEIPSE